MMELITRSYSSDTFVMLADGSQATLASLTVGTATTGPDGTPRIVSYHAEQTLRRLDLHISRHVNPLSMPALHVADNTDLALLYQPIGHTTLTTAQYRGDDWGDIRRRLAGLVGLDQLPPADPRERTERWDPVLGVPKGSITARGVRGFR